MSEDMTIGEGSGDLAGDLATLSPGDRRKVSEADGSPEWIYGSRFWLLQPSDDEEEGVHDEVSPDTEDFDIAIRYLCRSPSPVSGRDIADDSQELAWRTLRRMKKREEQRAATKAAMMLDFSEGTWCVSSLPLGSSVTKLREHVLPVMEPSLFCDDNSGGWTVVRRRRWATVVRRRPPVLITIRKLWNFRILRFWAWQSGLAQTKPWFVGTP
jgi:hypothetical protein